MRSQSSRPRSWDFHSILIPVIAAALISVLAWVLQATAGAHYNRLTTEDERRITADAQAYTDKRVDSLGRDLRQIREELTHLRDLQTEILLELRKPLAQKTSR